jgi:hypothetical protein
MSNICPCCHRRIPTPRKATTPKIDKRLEQDIAKANAAIGSHGSRKGDAYNAKSLTCGDDYRSRAGS